MQAGSEKKYIGLPKKRDRSNTKFFDSAEWAKGSFFYVTSRDRPIYRGLQVDVIPSSPIV